MQTGQEKLGMQTMNQSLATLYFRRQITLETAISASSMREELQEMINRGVGVVPGRRAEPRSDGRWTSRSGRSVSSAPGN